MISKVTRICQVFIKECKLLYICSVYHNNKCRRCCYRLSINIFFILYLLYSLSSPLTQLLSLSPHCLSSRLVNSSTERLCCLPKATQLSLAKATFKPSQFDSRDYVLDIVLLCRIADTEWCWSEMMYLWGQCITARQHTHIRKWKIVLFQRAYSRGTWPQLRGQTSQRVCSQQQWCHSWYPNTYLLGFSSSHHRGDSVPH